MARWLDGLRMPIPACWRLAASDSTVYIGGEFVTVNGKSRKSLAAMDMNGTLSPWDPRANGRVVTLAASNDTIYAGGNFSTIGFSARNLLAAINTSGETTPWNPGPTDFYAHVNALETSGDAVLVGGAFTNITGKLSRSLGVLSTTGAGDLVP